MEHIFYPRIDLCCYKESIGRNSLNLLHFGLDINTSYCNKQIQQGNWHLVNNSKAHICLAHIVLVGNKQSIDHSIDHYFKVESKDSISLKSIKTQIHIMCCLSMLLDSNGNSNIVSCYHKDSKHHNMILTGDGERSRRMKQLVGELKQ